MRGIIGILLWGGLLCGCTRPTQAVMADVDPYKWSEEAAVKIENADTLTLRDLSLVIRSNRLFREDTLHLELTLRTPDSSRYSEVVAFPVRHIHRPAALRLIDEIPYRHDVILNQFGTYRLTLKPLHPIRGIEAAGINVVRASAN
ncbi:MAG: hypothetical protein E7137_04655 [Rikenellaceae bacterium]|nr:hypothetical protein [Rikenellaceae bacterium]